VLFSAIVALKYPDRQVRRSDIRAAYGIVAGVVADPVPMFLWYR